LEILNDLFGDAAMHQEILSIVWHRKRPSCEKCPPSNPPDLMGQWTRGLGEMNSVRCRPEARVAIEKGYQDDNRLCKCRYQPVAWRNPESQCAWKEWLQNGYKTGERRGETTEGNSSILSDDSTW